MDILSTVLKLLHVYRRMDTHSEANRVILVTFRFQGSTSKIPLLLPLNYFGSRIGSLVSANGNAPLMFTVPSPFHPPSQRAHLNIVHIIPSLH
jgi:predicted alpha/beta-hydrolase family hydrolase